MLGRKILKIKPFLILIVFVFASVLLPNNVFALSAEQKELYDKSIYYYDIDGTDCFTDSGSSTSTDLSGFSPDPAAVEYYKNTNYQDNKTMKQLIEELKPLYIKAAATAGIADWEVLPAIHNLEFNLRRDNPTTNTTFRTPFQMAITTLEKLGYDLSKPMFTPGHTLTDDEFVEVATISAKEWVIRDAKTLGIDATKGMTPEQAARVAVAYKSGAGSVWFNGTLDFKGHAYAWAGYNDKEFKIPMAYVPGSPYGDEQPSNLINRPGVATLFGILKQGGGGVSVGAGCSCSDSVGSGNTVFLDPGHGGKYRELDPATGLLDHEWINDPETYNVWDVANKAKGELEKAGYSVVMSKSSVDEVAGFREKANRANNSKAAIGVSIHTTGGNTHFNWGQVVGGKRTWDGKDDVFKNQAVADKSQQYVSIFNEVRKEKEKISSISNDLQPYDGRPDISGGNLPLIMLWSNIPWVYLEKATGVPSDGPNRALSEQEINEYTSSVVEGVKKALPPSGGSGGSVNCGPGSFNPSSFDAKIKDYVWPDGPKGTQKKPEYDRAIQSRKSQGKYVGSDGIDCGGFVTTLFQESGIDPNYGGGPTGVQEKYLKDNSSKYENLGIVKDSTKLKKGDIAIWNASSDINNQGNAGHTYVYTGKIDGFVGDSAEASLDSQSPHSMTAYFNGNEFTWFRPK